MTTSDHLDASRARWLIDANVWTLETCAELREIVVRNELIDAPLGRARYLVLRDLLWTVEPCPRAVASARAALRAIEAGTVPDEYK